MFVISVLFGRERERERPHTSFQISSILGPFTVRAFTIVGLNEDEKKEKKIARIQMKTGMKPPEISRGLFFDAFCFYLT